MSCSNVENARSGLSTWWLRLMTQKLKRMKTLQSSTATTALFGSPVVRKSTGNYTGKDMKWRWRWGSWSNFWYAITPPSVKYFFALNIHQNMTGTNLSEVMSLISSKMSSEKVSKNNNMKSLNMLFQLNLYCNECWLFQTGKTLVGS